MESYDQLLNKIRSNYKITQFGFKNDLRYQININELLVIDISPDLIKIHKRANKNVWARRIATLPRPTSFKTFQKLLAIYR